MNPTGKLTHGAACIRCHEYTVLVLDHDVPEECKSDEFLSNLDTIILLRWTAEIAVSVSQLLIKVKDRGVRQLTDLSSVTTAEICNKLCCLVLPESTYNWNRSTSATRLSPSGPSSRETALCATIRLATELGIHILRIRCSVKSGSLGVQVPDSSIYLPFIRTTDLVHEDISWSHHTRKQERGKYVGIVLYQKYGVGCLKLIPVFEASAEETPMFNALFRWLPYPTTWPNQERFSQSLICCTKETTKNNTSTSMRNARKEIPKFLPSQAAVRKLQLLMESLIATCSKTPVKTTFFKSGAADEPQQSLDLVQSRLFSGGSNSTAAANAAHIRRTSVPQTDSSNATPEIWSQQTFRNSLSLKELNNTRIDKKQSQILIKSIQNESEVNGQSYERVPDGRCSPTFKSVDAAVELCPLNGTLPRNPSNLVMDSETLVATEKSKMHKSISYPPSLSWNSHGYHRQAPNLNGISATGSVLCCATVLLAIPEVGESDYYPESPQCLTVDELRKLGVSDDEDDDDDEDEVESNEDEGEEM